MIASDKHVPLYVKKRAQNVKSPHPMTSLFVVCEARYVCALGRFEELAQVGEIEPRAETNSPGHAPVQIQFTRSACQLNWCFSGQSRSSRQKDGPITMTPPILFTSFSLPADDIVQPSRQRHIAERTPDFVPK